MKRASFILGLLISLTLNSQINLENTYPSTSSLTAMSVVRLTKSGYKYVYTDNVAKTVKLYNLNHSLWKTMTMTVPSGATLFFGAGNISDSLFNTDAQIEYTYSYWITNYTTTPATFTSGAYVMSESGTPLLHIPQCRILSVANTGTANGWKLLASVDSANKMAVREHRVYSLVGGLPMNTSTGTSTIVNPPPPPNPTITTIIGETTSNPVYMSAPIPNPTMGKSVIAYQLPQGQVQSEIVIFDINGKELKRYVVDGNFNTLELDNSDLSSGTYLYQMQGTSEPKKLLIVK